MADHCRRLDLDREFLSREGALSERLMDRVVLHLFRIYPQILNNSEAEAFRSLSAPVHIRISHLLLHLQSQSNKACKEFYNALELNGPQIYKQLPSKHPGETPGLVATNMDICQRERYVLNNRGPIFFLACFSVAAGLATVLYYCKEETKSESVAKKIVGFSSLGFGRRARRYFLAFLEDQSQRS